jgi:hypothetical protein
MRHAGAKLDVDHGTGANAGDPPAGALCRDIGCGIVRGLCGFASRALARY